MRCRQILRNKYRNFSIFNFCHKTSNICGNPGFVRNFLLPMSTEVNRRDFWIAFWRLTQKKRRVHYRMSRFYFDAFLCVRKKATCLRASLGHFLLFVDSWCQLRIRPFQERRPPLFPILKCVKKSTLGGLLSRNQAHFIKKIPLSQFTQKVQFTLH